VESGRSDVYQDYEGRKARLRAFISSVADFLKPTTVDLAREMVDANEAPLALDLISEMLVDANARISAKTFAEFGELAKSLDLDDTAIERLQPLVEG
jgi:hypothetical protein